MSGLVLARRRFTTICLSIALMAFGAGLSKADQAERAAIDAAADLALQQLYSENPGAQTLAGKAEALLIFPSITKAGLGVGAQAGKGVLRQADESVAYYRTRGVSFGFQAGAQTFGYVLMFMTDSAYQEFLSKNGFELGVDASVAVIEAGASATIDTTNVKADTLAIVFNEKGLMYSATIEGSKISRLDI